MLLGLTGLSVAGAVIVSTCTLCYAVSTDGSPPLAYVQGEDTYQTAVRQVEDQVSEILRSDYRYAQETTMALTIAPKNSLQTSDQLTASQMETVDQVKAEYILTIDGLPIGACESREAIDQALQGIKDTYTNQFTVSAYFDNTVDVVFDVVEEKTLPIQVTTNYLKIADGYILYGTDISKETVTLSGPSTELSKVETCTAEVTYSGELTSPVTLDTGLRFYTRSGGEVKFEYTTLETDSVEVTLQVYKLATLPVEVSFINAPRDFDPSVLVYSLSKKTLNVAGPESQIDRLSTLSVGTIDLSTFALDKVYEMPIELPSGIRLLDNISTITVSFDSSRLETKTMNLPASCVQVINLPSTYTLTVETERLMNVTLCGPAGSLEALNPEQVVIEIDADDFYVAIGQQNIACRLYVPANDKIFALGSYVVQCKIESN